MSGYNIHLVGSIPLPNAAEVFETVSAALGPQLLRIPDGETGERAGWMGWLGSDFQSHPDLEPTDETFQPHAAGRSTISLSLEAVGTVETDCIRQSAPRERRDRVLTTHSCG